MEFAHTSEQTIANNISGTGNVVRSGSGVVKLSGALTYTGTTTINDGTTLKIVNNTYSNKDFNTSTALAGEGTLDLETIGISGTKQSWIFFSTDNAQDFSGLVKLTGAVTFDKDTSLKNATLHVSANCLATLHTDSAKNLAVKVLNTDSGSTVRYSHDPESTENLPYATLTVGSGTVNGTLGEANPSTAHLYFNKIHLVKTSDESATGGTLTINGNYYYTGTTTINAGTLKFTNNFATSSGLAGSGTLKMSGNGNGNGIYFGITDSASQPFTGTIQINDSDIGGKYRIRIAVLDGNSYKAANIKLPYATMEINGNTTGKESELIFNNAASSLSIGTLNGNPYSRILNLDDKTTSNTYCNLTVNSGNFAGEIGRNESSSSSYKYVNYINFTKASNGSADGGTLTIKGNVYYTGTTTIEAGTIRIENNGAKDSYKYFTASTALTGSGTLELAGSGWIGFSINSTTQQEFTGTVKVKNKIVIRGASATKALNLGKGTLRLEEGATVGLFVNTNSSGTLTNISALTVKELNTDIGSTILLCTNNTTSLDEKSGSLTVASGTVNGDFGQANPDITWYNQVNLFKVSDESDDGGTLIINGNNYYTGSIDIQGGTLKLTGSATLSQGATTIAQGAQLDFGYEDDLENPIEITDDNPISGSGKIVKSGSGVLKIDNINYADTISAESFVVNAGELDFRGYFEGSIEINNDAVFSPGNSIGTLDVTGDVIVNSGTALFEFGEYTGADVNHDVLNIREDNTFTAGNRMISLAFNSEFPAETWAADEDKSFLLISGAGFEDGKDYSQWLGTNTDLFSLTGGSDGLYLTVGASPEPVAGVPEPS
ncbi:MAG: autotransporter-associated beta strand repeat-containing protein, partial [Thermoguttaceae bacterium]|nr:autotransporter-associated beta strand repeat-containing protein [Thermoguttaceae bacterium]